MTGLPAYNPNAIQTKARRAVWDAIDNWQPLLDWQANCDYPLWKQRFEGDLNEILSKDGPISDLPQIAVRPAALTEGWETNRMAKFVDQVVIDVKTVYIDQAEELSEMIWQAVWQSAPADNPTMGYVRSATGRNPTTVSVQRAIGQIGNSKAWVYTLTIGFEPSQDLHSTILQARVAT
jgi:hypothetical protein